ncbi:MAG: glycosyltransferase family 2 protein [Alphaproteobacteria bacterium]|nr:glycosyltransferase family 2 protein [Alphaproteobacteria bacterium]
MPKISVIVPIYNTEKYLEKCLDSVLGQTFKDIEIICVNDGSQDDSAAILKKYALKDRRIKIITQSNQGISVARNVGIENAKSGWIAFLDSDDMLPSYALQVLYDIVQKTNVQIASSRVFLRDEVQDVQSLMRPSDKDYVVWTNGLADFVRDSKIFSSVTNKLFDVRLFKKQRFSKGMVFEDWPVATMLFSLVDRYATTNIPCYIYRRNEQSTTHTFFSTMKIDSYIEGVRMIYRQFYKTDRLAIVQKRMAVAIKMLVNKVYHAWNKELTAHLLPQIDRLFSDHIVSLKQLTWKTRFRLWRLRHQ